jgi:hypothetical protein
VDEMVYVFEDTLLRLEGSVIEVFRQLATDSQRTPLIWAGADLEPKKGDQIQVTVGLRQGDGFYGNKIVASNAVFSFGIPASEEPRLRSFLDEAERRAGQGAAGR